MCELMYFVWNNSEGKQTMAVTCDLLFRLKVLSESVSKFHGIFTTVLVP